MKNNDLDCQITKKDDTDCRITIRLEKTAHEILLELSKKYKCTRSWLIRRAIIALKEDLNSRRITL